MSQSVIGALRVNLGLDSAQFRNGLNQSRTQLANFGRMAAAGAAAVTAAATAGAAAMGVMAGRAIEANHELRALATLSGSSVAELRNMAIASREFGIEQSKLADILKDTRDRVGDFLETGGGPMADYFENIAPLIGQTAEEFRNLSGPEALQKYFDGLQAANLGQNEMTFYLEAIASDATALIPLLRDGGAAMAMMADENERLNLTLSETESATLEEARKAMLRIKDVMEGVANTIALQISPNLIAMTGYITDAAVESGGFQRAITNAFEGMNGYALKGLDLMHDFAIFLMRVAVKAMELNAAFLRLGASIVYSMSDGMGAVQEFVTYTLEALNKIPGFDLDTNVSLGSDSLFYTALALDERASEADIKALIGQQNISRLVDSVLPSDEIALAVSEARAAIDAAAGAGTTGGASGGSGSGRAQTEADRITESQNRVVENLRQQMEAVTAVNEQAFDSMRDNASQTFADIVTGATSVADALRDIFRNFANQGLQRIGGSLFDSFMGSSLGGLFSFDGGGYTGSGARSGGVDGKGGFPAILHPNETVIDHTRGQAMSGMGGGSTITLRVLADQGVTLEQVGEISKNVSVEVFDAKMPDAKRRERMGV